MQWKSANLVTQLMTAASQRERERIVFLWRYPLTSFLSLSLERERSRHHYLVLLWILFSRPPKLGPALVFSQIRQKQSLFSLPFPVERWKERGAMNSWHSCFSPRSSSSSPGAGCMGAFSLSLSSFFTGQKRIYLLFSLRSKRWFSVTLFPSVAIVIPLGNRHPANKQTNK